MEDESDVTLEILHNLHGDRQKGFNIRTKAGREELQNALEKLLTKGTAIFVERNKKTYRLKGYDAEKDKVIIEASTRKGTKQVLADPKKGRKTAVAPVAGG